MKSSALNRRVSRLLKSVPAVASAGLASSASGQLVSQDFDPGVTVTRTPGFSVIVIDEMFRTIGGSPESFSVRTTVGNSSEGNYLGLPADFAATDPVSGLLFFDTIDGETGDAKQKAKVKGGYNTGSVSVQFAVNGTGAVPPSAGEGATLLSLYGIANTTSFEGLAALGPSHEFFSPVGILDFNYASGEAATDPYSFSGGSWTGGASGYLSLRVQVSEFDFLYGWMNITYEDAFESLTLNQIGFFDFNFNTAVVPEPASSVLLLAAGAGGLAAFRRRRRATNPVETSA
jgi:hypothetical protein